MKPALKKTLTTLAILIAFSVYFVMNFGSTLSSLYGHFKSSTTQVVAPPKPSMKVTVIRPTEGKLDELVRFFGQVVAREDVIVASDQFNVHALDVMVEEGDRVSKGQVLVELDTKSLELQLKQSATGVATAQSEYDRQNKIKEFGGLSDAALFEKRQALENAKAQYDEIKMRMDRSNVLAAAGGIVYQRNVDVGSLIGGGDVLFRIARDAKIEMEIRVPEFYLPRLRNGQKGTTHISGYDQPLNSSIRYISPYVDSGDRAAVVRLSTDNIDFVSIGTFISVELIIDQHEGLVIPVSSLQSDSSGQYVWCVENNIVSKAAVQVMFRDESRAIVTGLEQEMNIVAKAGAFLREGEVIQSQFEDRITLR